MNIPFVTSEDVQNWVGSTVILPEDIDRLISRASELIRRKTRHLTDNPNLEEETAIKNAACAQVEYWIQIDEASDVTGPLGPMKIEDFSFNSKFGRLGPRCKEILIDAGLMYKGVNGSGRYNIEGKDVT